VSDTFGIRVAGKYDSTEGYMTDVFNGGKFPSGESLAGRVTLAWAPTDALNITAKVEYGDVEREADPIAYVAVKPNPINTLGAVATGNFTAFPGAAELMASGDGINNLSLNRSGQWYPLPLTVFEGFGANPTSMADLSLLGNTCQLPVRTCNIPFADLEIFNSYITVDYHFANDLIFTSLLLMGLHRLIIILTVR